MMTPPMLPWFDPAAPDVLADPHPVYDALRETGLAEDPLGVSVFGYRDSEAIFHDARLRPGIGVVVEQQGTGATWGVPGRSLTDSDGAAHQRLRRAVSPWFSARRVGLLQTRTRALVDELLERHRPGDELEVMADLADVVPSRLFCWMVGAPDEDAELVAELSKDLLLVFAADPRHAAVINAARERLVAYVAGLAARKARRPGDDLATALGEAVRAGNLDAGDDACLLEELVSAAVDNTAATAALALKVLAERPEVWSTLRRHPELLAVALEECGRFEPSIRTITKVTVDPVDVAGVRLDPGTFVTIRVAAVHRDPAVFREPHRFLLDRVAEPGQLAFGVGRHYCLGAALGRMEVAEIVGGVLRRASVVELAAGAELDVNGFGVVHRLPVRISA